MTGKRTKALGISPETRDEVLKRDKGCIFRGLGGCSGPLQCMHFISRGKGGLGIPKNLAMGCMKHHMLLDQSTEREEMLKQFRHYLNVIYEQWNEEELVYRKW